MKTNLLRCVAAAWLVTAALSGCDDDATTAVVDNAFAPPSTTVWKVWWSTTLFPAPVAPRATSEVERTVPGTDFAYALLAPGWSPADRAGGAPPRLVAARSAVKVAAPARERLHIVVSDDTFEGDCAAGHPLAAEDARFIVERIFPGDFAGRTYDPTTCTTSRADAGASDADAGTD